jgi:signal transduction histidine kinase
MKVLNYTTSYFAILLLLIISIWATIFYYAMLDEIYDSIDDGLDNQKGLIIQRVAVDSSILRKSNFEEGDYAIREISDGTVHNFHDVFIDTMMYMQNEKDFEPVRLLRTVFVHNGKYYQMEVITSMVEEDDLMGALFYSILWLYVGLVGSILLLNNILLKRIWRPFYHLLRQLKAFRLEKPAEVQVPETRIDEFVVLNDTIKKLLQSNIDAYNSQKHFIENASHELQTPLAISISKLEALAESGTLSKEQLELLATSMDNLQKLTRLNKSLLLLFKIENKQFTNEEEVNINQEIKRIAADFSDQLEFRKLQVSIDEQETATVMMNADLAGILFTNLIRNAILHNYPGGSINIIIRQHTVEVINTSNSSALPDQHLFTRFSKTETATTSNGLGLSLVKAIVQLYDFKVRYSYKDRHHFVVTFS